MSVAATSLPQYVRDLLGSPPHRGGGLNLWFYRVARLLHLYRDSNEVVNLLRAATAGEPVKPGEIERAVKNSAATAWKPGQPVTPTRAAPAWPPVNTVLRESIIASGPGLYDSWENSPVRFEDNKSHAEETIDVLFPGNPFLCIGQSDSDFATRQRQSWRGQLAQAQLIVPSPMTAVWGHRKEDGKESQHTLENTGPRRFLVIEQDKGDVDEQTSILFHLAKNGPLALTVHSGSKSIHGWFFCAGRPEERLHNFMRYAVSLGADDATWGRSQFVRLPGGSRDNGKPQTIYWFNPGVVK